MEEHHAAFTAIYHDQYAKVFRLCKGYFNGDEATAVDAAQEVFIKVWQNLEGFRHESSISTWIYRIAVNTCLLYLRKAATQKEMKTATLPDRPEEQYDAVTEQRLQKMYNCIQQLDETGRLIILMVLEGVDYGEIAIITGISADTLRVKIHRIKKSLTNCVQL
jgi:RNA polymerase sigma-70 factor (ECF subfamily)